MRLAHPKPLTDEHKSLYKWIVDGELQGGNVRLEAFEKLKASTDAKAAVELIVEHKMPRECVPTELLNDPKVWEALMESMPITAMIRNLGNLTKVGLVGVGSKAAKQVVERLNDANRLRKARVHPIALLLAHATYTQGHGHKGKGQWQPVPEVIDALDAAFYKAFEFVQPTGKRYMLGIDVSGSMTWSYVANSPLSACEAATAMAMVTLQTEPACTPMAFSNKFKQIPLSRKMRLADALRHTRDQNFGGTDCALPMEYARKQKLEIDVFVVYTDSETWAGNIHPAQALAEYRQATGIPAKLVVMGMTSNGFSIANPNDPGMLDVVGFDTSVPQALKEFAA